MGSVFEHYYGILASVTYQVKIGQKYTKVEHVISRFASSKFPSVIILTKLFFRFVFSIVGAIVHILPFETLLFALAGCNWENEAFRCCEFNDGDGSHSFPGYQR